MNNMVMEFKVLTDILKENKDGSTKVIKRNVEYKKILDTDKASLTEFIDDKGKIVKKYTMCYIDNNFFKLNHPYEEIKKLLQPIKIIGFVYGKQYNKKTSVRRG